VANSGKSASNRVFLSLEFRERLLKFALREALRAVRVEIFRETTHYGIFRKKMAIGQYCAVALPLLRLFIER
jgi:hypothetical protein